MTKKHFIALADAIREFNDAGFQMEFRADQIDCLAAFCQRQNPRFNTQRWVDYIGGHCGPNGGAIKRKEALAV
jgi:hypothetical protein